jgi:osmoprotectant transport system permease protein
MINAVIDWLSDPTHWSGPDGIPQRLLEHLGYSLAALVIAALIGIPLGLAIGHTGKGTFLVAGLANALRALPTLGLVIVVVLVVSPVLQGELAFILPSIVVLVVLAVPPILTSTYAGVQGVDPAARDAAYGMGMTGNQVLFKVETPCALPLVLSGIRSAMLQIVSTATIAAYVSLGGLGRYVIDGQATINMPGGGYPQMLSGAILVAALAVAIEAVLAGVQRLIVPRGLAGRYRKRGRAEVLAKELPVAEQPEEELAGVR